MNTKECLLKITYTDGTIKEVWFNNYGDAMRFVNNEGDHVADWETFGE